MAQIPRCPEKLSVSCNTPARFPQYPVVGGGCPSAQEDTGDESEEKDRDLRRRRRFDVRRVGLDGGAGLAEPV